jgi:hypothetical protein
MRFDQPARLLVPTIAIAAAIASALWVYRDAISKVLYPDEPTVNFKGGRVHFVQAEKRAVFVFHERTNAGFACPEPSPDVHANVDRAFKALDEAQANSVKDVSMHASLSLDATTKLVTDALMHRTQGLQVLRDMLFQACLANVRGDMSGLQYVNFVSNTLPKLTTSLIATELVTRHEAGVSSLSNADLQLFLNFLILNSQ